MGIFDFFKRNNNSITGNVDTPDELKHLVSQSDFNFILSLATRHLQSSGYVNVGFSEDVLFCETTGDNVLKSKINFINLVKSVICEERNDWGAKTIEYLDSFNKDAELESEVLLSFDKAKGYLTVRLQPATNYNEEPYQSHLETLVYKVDIPETYSLLALDLPSRFHILTIDEINVWAVDKADLFAIAHNNLLDRIENIEAQKHDCDGAVIVTLFDRDYSASYCIDFSNSCNNLIGKKGSLISFPTRGSVFVHPITDIVQFNIAYRYIVEKTNRFFDDDPGPVTRNIYWFYENSFTNFEITWNDGEITYTVPNQLNDLLNS